MISNPDPIGTLSPEEKRALLTQLLERREAQPRSYPTSFAQQRLWFLDQLVPGNPFYCEAITLRVPHPVDEQVLTRALREVTGRHESLRTVFREGADGPRQIVRSDPALDFEAIDLRALSEAERDEEAVRLALAESRRAFDLSSGPLARTRLIRLSDDDHVLLVTMHHIICDGWSLNIFVDELSVIYDAFLDDRPSPLEPLQVQYADFAVWQREHLRGAELDRLLGYWKRQLDGVETLRLPTDRPRPPVQTFAGAADVLTFQPGIYDALKALARQEGATLFMVLLAAYAALLHRYCDQDDIVVGCPVANRNRREIEGLIGFFVNSLVMRIDVSCDPTFRELIRRVRAVALDAYAHQDLPFEKLVEEISPERELSRNPLFQVTFQLFVAQTGNPAADTAAEATSAPAVTRFDVERTTAKFDVRLDVYEIGAQLDGMIEYNTDLFDADTIARMARHFMSTVEQTTRDPDRRVSRVDLVDDAERASLDDIGTGRALEIPAGLCLHHLVERQARRTADAVAVISGADSLTYGALEASANALARRLRDLGVTRGAIVGVAMERRLELVVALYAVLKAGAAYVPIDPSYPIERVRFMLADAAAAVLLTETKWAHLADSSPTLAVSVDAYAHHDSDQPAHTDRSVRSEVAPDDVAYVLYTSGTTGVPKGTAITHRAIVNHMLWMEAEFPLDATDVVLQRTPIGFDASVWEFYAPLMSGARLVLAPPGLAADVAPVIDTIVRERVTIMQLVPSLLRLVLDDSRLPECTTLRRLFFGGEALPVEMTTELPSSFAPVVVNLYGPTEATIDSTFHVCTFREQGPTVPIGGPIANTRVYVVDRWGQLVPRGIAGELWIAGAGLARGYWGHAARATAGFGVSAWGERVYRTGDRVRWRGSTLEFLGRSDSQVKVRGNRVELGEIEAVIGAVPEVAECVVTTHEGRGGAELVGYVVPRVEARSDAAASAAPVGEWREVFEQVYRGRQSADPRFETVGWTNSATGEALSAAEMREWLTETVARLQPLGAQRVLEVGCGTGLLLFALAEATTEYVGTDFSAEALAHVRAQVEAAGLHGVRLEERPATAWDGVPAAHFDLVILNSVVQYFPDEAYLRAVVAAAARVVRPGGHLFVGDVRHLGLHEAYAAWVEQRRAAPDEPAEAVAARVRERLLGETELLLAPEYFAKLRELVPSLTHGEVQAKFGTHWNELTRFRYDVLLQVGGDPPVRPAVTWRAWQGEAADHLAAAAQAQPVGWRGVATARLGEPVALARALHEPGPARGRPRAAPDGAEPEAVRAAGGTVRVRYGQAADGFDLLVSAGGPVWWLEPLPAVPAPWAALASDPWQGHARRAIVPRVRAAAAARVPEWMVPSAWVVLERLPLTAHGKVDRRALPAPDRARPDRVVVAPRTALEAALGQLWREVLGHPRIGVTENFFHLGGHSLLATQLLSRLRDTFHVPLPLRALFEAPTIAEQAVLIEQLRAEGSRLDEPAMTRLPRETFRRTLQDLQRDR